MIRLFLLFLAVAPHFFAAKISARETDPPLTVVVVIDQFPMEYLDRFGDLFADGGFRRLAREGALFTECRFSHAVLETGPGHTTIATGTNARDHGIVGNAWFDADGKEEYCVACDSVYVVSDSGITHERASCPRNIRSDGLSDFWNAQFGNDAKVWSLSLKDRAACGSLAASIRRLRIRLMKGSCSKETRASGFCFWIGDVPIPTRYFDEASSINFKRSTKYGLQTVQVMLKYKFADWGLLRSPLFSQRQLVDK